MLRGKGNEPVRRCMSITVLGYRKGRGQQKKSWNEIIKYDLNFIGLMEDIV